MRKVAKLLLNLMAVLPSGLVFRTHTGKLTQTWIWRAKAMMQFSINDLDNGDVCEIVVTGEISASSAIDMLEEVWQSDVYQAARCVLWDVERCEAFPDFNDFMTIVNFTRANKPNSGPSYIAFYSYTFSNSMLARVLQGFVNALPHKMALFEEKQSALAWFSAAESDAA